MESVKYRNKYTGEIVTQVPLLQISEYEEVCGIYGDTILPDEQNKCSLCGKHNA